MKHQLISNSAAILSLFLGSSLPALAARPDSAPFAESNKLHSGLDAIKTSSAEIKASRDDGQLVESISAVILKPTLSRRPDDAIADLVSLYLKPTIEPHLQSRIAYILLEKAQYFPDWICGRAVTTTETAETLYFFAKEKGLRQEIIYKLNKILHKKNNCGEQNVAKAALKRIDQINRAGWVRP